MIDKNRGMSNPSLNLMSGRLGIYNRDPKSEQLYRPIKEKEIPNGDLVDPRIDGLESHANRLMFNGGWAQQERMVLDKRKSLDRALFYSYQGANIKKVLPQLSTVEDEEQPKVRALINPNKNKMDYDDKIISVPFEYGFASGDVFEWLGTNTHWLIYLQDLEEIAYFRGDIRKCSYEISWEDEEGIHTTFAAIRGPVETKINYTQKHQISVDTPNHSLNILLPRTEAALKYFRRYSKFYLQGETKGSPQVCWRVEATDWISTPGILEVTAVEYYINESEDDLEQGLVGALKVEPENPNDRQTEVFISGETFIKPKTVYTYKFNGFNGSTWKIDTEKYPVDFEPNPEDNREIHLIWNGSTSGQFDITYGMFTKTIVVESLF